MRCTRLVLLLALACVIPTLSSSARAQSGPPSSSGGLTATLQPDNGGPAPSPLRSLIVPDLGMFRRWMSGLAVPFQSRPVARPAVKVRRATAGRGPAGAP